MRRLIETISAGQSVAKVYRDSEWGEFVVSLFRAGVKTADYHTEDKTDALQTARLMVECQQ